MNPARADLALGTAQLGMAYGIANRRGRLDDPAATRLVHAAWELGIRAFDTAPAYGEAEDRLGAALRDRADGSWWVSTKLAALPADATAAELPVLVDRSVEASRRRLGRDVLDVVLIHALGDLAHHGRALVDALQNQRAAGRARHVGVSITHADDTPLLAPHRQLDAVQAPFHLWDRTTLGLAHRPYRQARSALLQGLLVLSPDEVPERLAAARPWVARLLAWLAELDLRPLDAAVAFAVTRSGAHHVVLGAEQPEQLAGLVRAARTPLPRDFDTALAARFDDVPAVITDPRRWTGPA